MDITNPGLVNVADQSCGNPSTAVQSLAIPIDSDALVPVADEGHPRADDVTSTKDGGGSKGPTPADAIVIQQPPASPSQSLGQIPGVAPLFLPFPQISLVNTVDGQQSSQSQAQAPEFTVMGPSRSVQTNQDEDTLRDYTITGVRDADTGGPVVVPSPPPAGSFGSVQDTGGSTVTVVSPAPLAGLAAGDAVSLAGAPPTYDGIHQISNVLSLSGTFGAAAASISGTKTTLGSTTPLPAGLASAKAVSIAGAPYTGDHLLSDVVNSSGTFIAAGSTTPPGPQIIISSPSPTGLSDGQLVNLPGTYLWRTVSDVTDLSGSFVSAADSIVNPGVTTTLTSLGSLPATLQDGQRVIITGSAHYNNAPGTAWVISNVNLIAGTFDISTAFAGNDSGNWSVHTFQITAAPGAASGTWTAYTFDIDVAPGITSSGAWTVYTFEISAAYSGSESGTWTKSLPPGYTTSRYRLYVSPQDLLSSGLSLAGRPIVFDDVVLPQTAANNGAARTVEYFGSGYIIVSRDNPADPLVPSLATPQAGDSFTLHIQRQGSETFNESLGSVSDVTILPPPINVPPAPVPSFASEGPIGVSTGPQPGKPIITGGVQAPTAITVNVADQATSVGLPANVYI
jgi:hypothetical protein